MCNLVYFVRESRRPVVLFYLRDLTREKREWRSVEGASREDWGGGGANLAAALRVLEKTMSCRKSVTGSLRGLLRCCCLSHSNVASSVSLYCRHFHSRRVGRALSGRFAHRLLLISASCINVSITRLSAAAAAPLLPLLLFLPPGPFAYSRVSSRRMDRLVCPHAILITGLAKG